MTNNREASAAFSYWMRFGGPTPANHTKSWRETKGYPEFNPNQPRVPAGNPDGGQWTDSTDASDIHNLSTAARALAEPMEVRPSPAANPYLILVGGRGGQRRMVPSVVINGRRTPVSPRQAIQLDLLNAQASVAVREARAIQKGWRPTPGFYQGVNGLIAQRRAEIAEAQQFVASRLPRRNIQNETLADIMRPGNSPARGRRKEKRSIYGISRSDLVKNLGRLMRNASESTPPSSYGGRVFILPNGDRFGVRWSRNHGTTLEVLHDSSGQLKRNTKWHWE